jgi:NADH-quinone oxidoreductase subunit G
VPELGAFERGEHMQISTYIEKSLTSELSGNIIDLCPVGALTSKPYEFKARTWELRKTESIDVLDAVGSNIRVDSKGSEVMRILPRLNEEINEEWIGDKTRFAYDGLKYQRLDSPMVKFTSILEDASWEQAFAAIKERIAKVKPDDIGAIAGDLVDVESMLMMKEMLNKIGSYNHDCRQDGSLLGNIDRSLYIFNTTIAGVAQADSCLIFGANPRIEATILNARIGREVRNNNMQAALIGNKIDLTYNYKHLGNNPWLLKQLAEDENPYCKNLKESRYPMLILGADVMASKDFEATIYYAKLLCKKYNFVREDWNGYNVLQRAASRVGGLDIGFIPAPSSKSTTNLLQTCKIIFLMGADEIDIDSIAHNAFVVYIGHHGDKAAARADVILPGAAYTEKNATYVNLEGRVQHTHMAVHPHNMAQEDWIVMKQLATAIGIDLPYNNLADVRRKMALTSEVFTNTGELRKENFNLAEGKKQSFINDTLPRYIDNYYRSDSISRNSKTMARCTSIIKEQAQ